jgi:WD40 repeat protein
VSGGADRTLRFWDPMTGQARGNFCRHNFPITCLDVSADGQTLVTGSQGKPRGGELVVWRARAFGSGKSAGPDRGVFTHTETLVQAAFAPDGTLMAVTRAGKLLRWALSTRRPLEAPGGPDLTARPGRAALPDPASFTLGVDDHNKVHVGYRRQEQGAWKLFDWDPDTGEREILTFPKGKDLLYWTTKAAAPSVGLAATVETAPSKANIQSLRLRLVDLKSGKEPAPLLEGEGWSLSAISPDGRWLALQKTEGQERKLVVFDVERQLVAWEKPLPAMTYLTARFSPDSRSLAADARMFEAATGNELTAPPKGKVVTFFPDGKHYLVDTGTARLDQGRSVAVVEAQTGKTVATLRAAGDLTQMAFSPDGKTMIARDAGSAYEELVAWDLTTYRELRRFARQMTGVRTVNRLILLPKWVEHLVPLDDRTVLAVVTGGEIQAWDWTRGTRQAAVDLPPVKDAKTGPALTPDRKTLVLVAQDGTCQLWDPATWRPRKVLSGHSGAIQAALLDESGKTLTLVEPRAVRLLDVETGKEQAAHPLAARGPGLYPPTPFLSPRGEGLVIPDRMTPKDETWNDVVVGTGEKVGARYRHPDRVEALALDPRGGRGASVGQDRVIRVWETASGNELAALGGHDAPVRFLAFAPRLDVLVSAGEDGTVLLWDLKRKAEQLRLRGHADRVRAVAFSPDDRLLVTAGEDMVVRVWDLAAGRLRTAFLGHQSSVLDLAFSRDGRLLLAVAADGTVRVWACPAAGEPAVAAPPDTWGRPVVLSDDGKTLFVGHPDGSLTAIELTTTKARRAFAAKHAGPVTALALSPDGQTLASADADGQVKFWDPRSGKTVRDWDGAGSALTALAFSPDGKRLACGEGRPQSLFAPPRPGNILVRETATGATLATLRGHRDGVRALAFSPDGRRLASASDDSTARIWGLEPAGEPRTLHHAGPVFALVYSPDGRLVTGGLDPVIHSRDSRLADAFTRPLHIWDGTTGAWQATLATGGDTIRGLDLTSDGKTLAIIHEQGAVSVWDLPRKHGHFLLPPPASGTERVALARDGKTLVTTTPHGAARLWDLASRRGRELLEAPAAGPFAGLALTRKGDWLAVIEERREGAELRLLETARGRECASVTIEPTAVPPGWPGGTVHHRGTTSLNFSFPKPFEIQLDDSLHPLEPETVNLIRPTFPLAGPHHGRFVLAVSPDGRWAATARQQPFDMRNDFLGVLQPDAPKPPPPDPDIRLWDLKAGKAGPTLKGHQGLVSALAFAPDSRTLASAGDDRVVRLWDVGEGKLRHQLAGHGQPVRTLDFSPDGSLLASGDEEQVRLWYPEVGKEAGRLQLVAGASIPSRNPASMAFAPDGKILATVHHARPPRTQGWAPGQWVLKVWQVGPADVEGKITLKGGRELAKLPYPAFVGAFDPEGRTLFVAAKDLLLAYDVATGARLGQQPIREGLACAGPLTASTLNLEEPGKWVAHVSHHDVRTGAVKHQSFSGLVAGTVSRPALSGDGRLLLTFGKFTAPSEKAGPVELWQFDKRPVGSTPGAVKPLQTLEGITEVVQAVALSPDGRTAAVGSTDGKVALLEAASGKTVRTLEGGTYPVSVLVFSPDGKLLAGAAGSNEAAVQIWQVADGKELARLEPGHTAVTALAFATDGQKLATGAADGSVTLWSLPDARRLGGWQAHAGAVRALALDNDGARLASGGADGTAAVWDAAGGEAPLKPRKYRSAVNTVALSPDGKLLAVAVEAGLQLLDVANGGPLHTLPVGSVSAVGFSADGKDFHLLRTQVAPSTWKGTIQVNETTQIGRPELEIPIGP